jgi:epoxyqueuosine reductase
MNSETIKQQAKAIGFHLVGIAQADNLPVTGDRLASWLEAGYQADMAWMANPKRQDIFQVMPNVRSIISLGLNYYTPHQHSTDPQYGKISRYGWGRDYHKVMTTKLKALAHWLMSQDSQIETKYYVDTGPISDKAWAEKAGLGWIAKNGNVISRQYGSWIFLGEILTNLELTPDQPHTSHCGTCDRCLQACPTGAIAPAFVVDANKCIAYHTIENRAEELPANIKDKLSGWVAGCDICQDVCPWNIKFAQSTDISDFQPYPDHVQPLLTDLANMSEEDWSKRLIGSALRRIKPAMWRRNARANIRE